MRNVGLIDQAAPKSHSQAASTESGLAVARAMVGNANPLADEPTATRSAKGEAKWRLGAARGAARRLHGDARSRFVHLRPLIKCSEGEWQK